MDPLRNLMEHPRTGVAISRYIYDAAGHPKDTLKFNASRVEI
jgi:hypothetical protein